MKNTLILFVIFVLLGGGTAWYLHKGDSPQQAKTTLVGADRKFAVEDTEQVYKIFLSDRTDNVNTTLTRKGDRWFHNDGHKVRRNAMENLLNTIGHIEMKYKPAEAALKGMITDLATNSIKVELYNQANEKIKVYYVGGSTIDERGTYMIMEGAEQPYVVSLPSWEGNVRHRYSLKGDEWWDRIIFEKEVEDIKSVAVEYPRQKNKSFRLQREGNDYTITPFYDITPKINRPIKAGSGEAYLVGFESLMAEDFRNDVAVRDSISQLEPFAILSLEDMKGNETIVKFHPIVKEGSKMDYKSGEFLAGSDFVERYFADVNNGNFMMIQQRVFGKLFWAYEHFFE